MRRGERRLRFDLVGLSGFDLLGEFLRAPQQRRALFGRRATHAFAGGFLLGP